MPQRQMPNMDAILGYCLRCLVQFSDLQKWPPKKQPKIGTQKYLEYTQKDTQKEKQQALNCIFDMVWQLWVNKSY